MTTTPLHWVIGLLFGGYALSAALVALALIYGRQRGLIDAPGQRRSHAVPTPRGGGIGVVAAYLMGLAVLVFAGKLAMEPVVALALALAAVAGIGWLDDHRPQSARLRLLVHAAASLMLCLVLLGMPSGVREAGLLLVALWMLMTAINFTNFMDGSNGMIGVQAMAVSALLLLLALTRGQWPTAFLCALLIGSLAGFLPYNLPRAKIFMGDVGSGGVGLLLGAIILFGITQQAFRPVEGVIATSVLWLDAGLTLAQRMMTGKPWYRAHREHLFQWLIRSGWSHTRVAMAYLGWTLLVVLLMLTLLFLRQIDELVALGVVAALGIAVWVLARRVLLRQAAVSSPGKH